MRLELLKESQRHRAREENKEKSLRITKEDERKITSQLKNRKKTYGED